MPRLRLSLPQVLQRRSVLSAAAFALALAFLANLAASFFCATSWRASSSGGDGWIGCSLVGFAGISDCDSFLLDASTSSKSSGVVAGTLTRSAGAIGETPAGRAPVAPTEDAARDGGPKDRRGFSGSSRRPFWSPRLDGADGSCGVEAAGTAGSARSAGGASWGWTLVTPTKLSLRLRTAEGGRASVARRGREGLCGSSGGAEEGGAAGAPSTARSAGGPKSEAPAGATGGPKRRHGPRTQQASSRRGGEGRGLDVGDGGSEVGTAE